MADSSPSGIRTIAVTAADTEGRPVAAEIRIRVDAAVVGSFQLNREHPRGTIEIADQVDEILLEASFLGQRRAAQLTRDDSGFDFAFQPSAFRVAGEAEAGVTCPDGSKGNPCATCKMGGLSVRICV